MSNYNYQAQFGLKDTLTAGNTEKIIRGSDFDVEFNAIEAAIASKVDEDASNLGGTVSINGVDLTSTAAELNLVDGSTAGTVVNSKAVVYSDAGQVKATTLSIGDWVIKVDTNELVFVYNDTEVFKVATTGAITSADNVTAYGTI